MKTTNVYLETLYSIGKLGKWKYTSIRYAANVHLFGLLSDSIEHVENLETELSRCPDRRRRQSHWGCTSCCRESYSPSSRGQSPSSRSQSPFSRGQSPLSKGSGRSKTRKGWRKIKRVPQWFRCGFKCSSYGDGTFDVAYLKRQSL